MKKLGEKMNINKKSPLLTPEQIARMVVHISNKEISEIQEAQVKAINELIAEKQEKLEKERALIDRIIKVARDCLWINHCRCDGAYTTRNKHEPNAVCGELDDLFNMVKEYEKFRGDK